MSAFRVYFEWEESPHVRTPELNATWARLEMYVDDVPITKVEDHRSRGVRDGIYVPLYPVAEWLVANWWFLWNEWRADHPAARHNLLAAREGFALPDLSFLPTETRMRLIWRTRSASASDRVSFLLEGSQLVDKDIVREQIRTLIEGVIQRLTDRNLCNTFLTSEWEAILASERDPEQNRFCEQAARLGIDPFNPEPSVAESLEQMDTLLPHAVIDDFCDAVRPDEIPAGIKAVRDFLDSLEDAGRCQTAWHDVRERLAISNGHTPWHYGYRQAQRLREYLGITGPIKTDLVPMLRQVFDSVKPRQFDAPARIEAIAATGENDMPGIGITSRMAREESQRFLLCRALSDLLAVNAPSLVTRAETEHQQRNRAFAAEFLAPAAAIQERLSGDTLTEEDLEDLAHEFRVSGFVIRHQIENHKLATLAPSPLSPSK